MYSMSTRSTPRKARDPREHAEVAIESAKKDIESAKKGIESAKGDIESAKGNIESAKEDIESAKGVSEGAEGVSKGAEGVSESTKASIESVKVSIEIAKINIESARDSIKKVKSHPEEANGSYEKEMRGIESAIESLLLLTRNFKKDLSSGMAASQERSLPTCVLEKRNERVPGDKFSVPFNISGYGIKSVSLNLVDNLLNVNAVRKIENKNESEYETLHKQLMIARDVDVNKIYVRIEGLPYVDRHGSGEGNGSSEGNRSDVVEKTRCP